MNDQQVSIAHRHTNKPTNQQTNLMKDERPPHLASTKYLFYFFLAGKQQTLSLRIFIVIFIILLLFCFEILF